MTQHDSIFPQIKLPGGISSKATEYKELAAKGDKWESPVFSIGSASKTSNLAKPSDITRKNHSVTKGGIRGPQNIGNTESMTQNAHDPEAYNSTQQNYTNGSANPGFSNGSANGAIGNGSANGTHTNGSANGGFSNQVDQAFSKTGNGHPVSGLNQTTSTGEIPFSQYNASN